MQECPPITGFCTLVVVSALPIFLTQGRIHRKSSAASGNIPIFRKPAPETVRAATVWRSCSGSAEYVAVLSTQATVPGRLAD